MYYLQKGYAPIHYAVKRESADIEQVLNVLVAHHVSVNTRSLKDGETCLHMLVKRLEVEDATTLSLSLMAHGADPDYRNDVSIISTYGLPTKVEPLLSKQSGRIRFGMHNKRSIFRGRFH